MKFKEPAFETETELCNVFLQTVPATWTSYAETGGWDILLSRNSDGFQVGIQAKLRLNIEVINQTIESRCESRWGNAIAGPDCRAILVPRREGHKFQLIASYIGFTIIEVSKPDQSWNYNYNRTSVSKCLPNESSYGDEDWHQWCPIKRHVLPDYVPDVAAGASAPVQLTRWKIAAIKILLTLEQRGYVTRHDFKMHGIDHRRWLAKESGWLVNNGGHYIGGPKLPDLKAQHPLNWEQIKADADKWMKNGKDLFGA